MVRTQVVKPARISVYSHKLITRTPTAINGGHTVNREPMRSLLAPEPSNLNHLPTAESATYI